MQEILIRDELLMNVLASGLPGVEPSARLPEIRTAARREFAYLQLRMICELIGLSCLVAHGDLPAVRSKLRRASATLDIMRSLDRLHPNYFPRPTRQSVTKDAHGMWSTTPIESGALTKDEMKRLYGECGNVLHRGNVEKAMKGEMSAAAATDPSVWANKIWTLLEHHEITTILPGTSIIGLMKDHEERRPQISFFTAQPDGTRLCRLALRAE